MLIKVFGIWLMAANIQYLSPDYTFSSSDDDFTQKICYIKYTHNNTRVLTIYRTCDEVAAEINKQIRESK